MRRRAASAAAAVLLAGTAAGPAAALQERPVRIIMIGDSLAAGYGLLPEQACPSIVRGLAEEKDGNTEGTPRRR